MQEKLILLRQERNITQTELAHEIGITPKQYRQKELGKSKFNGDEMFLISNKLKLPIEDIFLPTTHQIGDISRRNEISD